ncbi:pentatricopeptide repeat-containing protein-like [Dorcoceras hygrometricum]|uniref:Pentatricopeptide repeat-containing protein-like n=1 Tax=Dorcoceras hygrometricum TaxID=472368 RepID=A0A2Z7A1Y1_9LAMI|nr:pentatricopeptide repeat-containing protein-like [Dorcoceras hygrometricum]
MLSEQYTAMFIETSQQPHIISHATSQLSQAQDPYLKLSVQQLLQAKVSRKPDCNLNYEMHELNQQLRASAPANNSLQKGYRMKDLLKRSPTIPRTYQTVAGNDGNSPDKLTVNSNLGFEAKTTIGRIFR